MSCEPILNMFQIATVAFEGEEIEIGQEFLEEEQNINKEASLKGITKEFLVRQTLKFDLPRLFKEALKADSRPLSALFTKNEKQNEVLTKAPFFTQPARESKKNNETLAKAPQSKTETHAHFGTAETKGAPKPTTQQADSKPETHAQNLRAGSRSEAKGVEKSALSTAKDPSIVQGQKWVHHETEKWWDNRYLKREDEKHGKREDEQSGEREEKKGKIQKIHKKTNVGENISDSDDGFHKPILERPKMGVFALYYILTKLGILSDGTANYSYKKEIEIIDADTTRAYQNRLDEIKKALEKEEEIRRWGIAQKVFSWIGSLFSIFTGVVLVATGVGAVAGAMLIIGGIIQITSQILELTGGWKKIAEILPGEDLEKKRAVIAWIQIGIAVVCLILAGIGVLSGGFAAFGEAFSSAQLLISGIANLGHSVSTIGVGIYEFMYNDRMADSKKYEMRLAQLKHQRQDLMEKVDWGLDRLQQLFEDLARALEFEVELFRADQLALRG